MRKPDRSGSFEAIMLLQDCLSGAGLRPAAAFQAAFAEGRWGWAPRAGRGASTDRAGQKPGGSRGRLPHSVFLVLVAVSSAVAQNLWDSHTIRPVVGSGSRGDGGPANAALLNGPFGLAEDSAGNIYISESNAGVIRRVRPDGVVERFAGSGAVASGREGRLALETDLQHPTALVIDQDGGLIFADSQACWIRKVLTDGTVRNLVGTGRCSTTSSGATRERRPLELDIAAIGGMVVDASGRLIFSDETANVVRRLDSDGMARTIAGTGTAGPGGDGGLATDAQFRTPRGLAFDSAGNLYIADALNCRVRRVRGDGIIENAAGTGGCLTSSPTFNGGGAATTPMGTLTAIAYDRDTDSILIASPPMARVLRLILGDAWLTPVLGNGRRGAVDSQSPLQYSIDSPSAILVSSRAGALIADNTSFAVLQVQGNTLARFAGYWPQLDTYPPAATARLAGPMGICFDSQGSLIVADGAAERILAFRAPAELTAIAGARYPTGYFGGDGGPATSAYLNGLKRVACAPNGDIYLIHGSRIRAIDGQGVIRTLLNTVQVENVVTSLNEPSGFTIDPQGRLFFSEADKHRVIRYDPQTRATALIAGTGTAGFTGDNGPATDARLNSPGDLAFDGQGNLLIADRGNRRVRRVSTGGTIQTVAGSDRGFWHSDTSEQLATDIGLDRIDGLAVDAAGVIYISEYSRLSAVSQDGRIHVITGYTGETDDGVKSYKDGPVNGCDGLAIDRNGYLYASLRHDGRVIAITPPGAPIDAGPPPSIAAVTGATAFGALASVAPGSWIEIYGSNLAVSAREWSGADFIGGQAPTSLDGTSVSIGGQPAIVAYISPNQINAQVPTGLTAGAQQIIVTMLAGSSAPHPMTVNAVQPALLAPSVFRFGGRQYAWAALADGTAYILPDGAMPGVTGRPARPGEAITLYGIGFGTLDTPPQFHFGDTPASVSYAGLAPGTIGLYQFNVVVPNVSDSDAVPLNITVGGARAEQVLFTAVRKSL